MKLPNYKLPHSQVKGTSCIKEEAEHWKIKIIERVVDGLSEQESPIDSLKADSYLLLFRGLGVT